MVALWALETAQEAPWAVTKLVDKPDRLQKGALVTSSLPEDHIIIADRLGQDAAYFPAAFGIRIYSRPSEAAGELLEALHTVSPDSPGR